MFGKRSDDRTPLAKAREAADGLRAGSWESVEALAMLAIEVGGTPEAARYYESALEASQRLSPGSWDSIRALTWLTRARRELG